MILSYIKTSINYLIKNMFLTFINLIGLVIGMCVCFFSLLYIDFELSFDDFHSNSDQIYRLTTDVKTKSGIEYRGSSAPMGPAIKERFSQVTRYARICLDYYIVQKDKQATFFSEENVAFADNSLFKVFDFDLLAGRKEGLLGEPYKTVLSESAALKYFGTTNVLGNTLLLDGQFEVTVSGLMKDIPPNSHFNVSMFISMPTLLETWWSPQMANNWKRLIFQTYLILPTEEDRIAVLKKIPALTNEHVDQTESKYLLNLERLKDVYLHGDPRGSRTGSISTGNVEHIYIFATIALFVLFIAAFNFVNLTTAFSIHRAKEIGIRKALGATKNQLRYQFLFDSLVLTYFAFLGTLLISFLTYPLFVDLAGKTLSTEMSFYTKNVFILFAIANVVGLSAGLYPAFFLSNLEAISTLKGKFTSFGKGVMVRKVLIVAQFSISAFLVISTLVISKQLSFMQQSPLGFDPTQKLVIDFHFDGRVKSALPELKEELQNVMGNCDLTMSSAVPGKTNHIRTARLENSDGTLQEVEMEAYFVDYDFLDQYKLKVIEGRGFSQEYAYDSVQSMLINETAMKLLGYTNPSQAVGKKYAQGGSEGQIIGVLKDFHFHSLQEAIKPLSMRMNEMPTFLTLAVQADQAGSAIKDLQKIWSRVIPGLPLSYSFLDQGFNDLYKSERQFSKMFLSFSSIAVAISGMGLLGLCMFMIGQRAKEISIRKVLGSSTISILTLILKDFMILIMAAFLIGAGIAWFSMHQWLREFPYKIDLSIWFFVSAGLMIISLAVGILGLQSLKVLDENPVNRLRSE